MIISFSQGTIRLVAARVSKREHIMRDLDFSELKYVSGASCSPTPPSCYCPEPTPTKTKNGNNGFGNGADANLAAPGNSGSTGGGKAGSVGDARGPR